ncbi:U11/U12 small nuclear ribonucleoprotein 35 kDa protein-like [Oppia nitens]|uniref:U11/U12 small nuclear ribonucleoprotein 35 kDa protein-like n=1 Tax=Oppia nitens TaxID=1686743 RepID=UPI0023DA7F4A|nr:U11/U12 small nuclear ribonucleoprotein 35 kDa protein-like [Oppia nitens]
MSHKWTPVVTDYYDPIRVASIDGTDTVPHDRAVIRAVNSRHNADKSIKSDSQRTIFVARLDHNTDEDTVRKYFSQYGTIVSLRLVRDIVTGLSKGYAFVEFKHRSTAQEVYRKANNELIDGRRILVDFEVGRTLNGWKPRRLGGGFGGRKEAGQLRFGCRDRPWRQPIKLRHESTDSRESTSGKRFKSKHK